MDLNYRLVKKLLPRTSLAEISANDPERCVLIQEQLFGHEYVLAVINDLNGSYVNTFVKRKLHMLSGETDRAIVVEDEQLQKLGEAISQKLGHIGNLDCDVIIGQNGCFLLEMNPRFGGGYPFFHIAGANLPAALIAWASGENHEPDWLRVRPNIMAAKFDCFSVIERRQQVEKSS